MNPFKWFNDLIERSALWYAVYIIGFRLICGKLFKSMTDNQYYVFSILFLSFFIYIMIFSLLKKYKNRLKAYKQYLYILTICGIIIFPAYWLVIFSTGHPLLGVWILLLIFLICCLSVIILDKKVTPWILSALPF